MALLLLTARIEEIYDEELPVGIQGGSAEKVWNTDLAVGACHTPRYFSQKKEIPLPSSYPNIYQILWSNVSLRDVK